MEKIRIALVDDETLLLSLMQNFLDAAEQTEVVFTATDGDIFLRKLEQLEHLPDLVIMDLKMKNMDGAETSRILQDKYPEMYVIIISSYYKKSFMGYMLKSGANAFLPKGLSPNQLMKAILTVFDKGFYFMSEQVDVMRTQISQGSPRPVYSSGTALSRREEEVLKLICQQKTTTEIADLLFVSPKTVEGHKSNLYLKTEARNIAGLVIYAIRKGLCDPKLC